MSGGRSLDLIGLVVQRDVDVARALSRHTWRQDVAVQERAQRRTTERARPVNLHRQLEFETHTYSY